MTTQWWVMVESDNPENFEHVKCGPFDTEAEAVHHMNESMQIQGFCEDDSIDCWTTDDPDLATRIWDNNKDNWGTYGVIKDGADE